MTGLKAPVQKGLEGIEPIMVLNDIQIELKGLENCYPALMANVEYSALRQELDLAETNRSGITFELMEDFYHRLTALLQTIQIDDNVINFGERRIKNKPPLASFLTANFDEFVEKVSLVKQKADFYEDAIEAAAHALILGEIPYGLNEIIPRFRGIVRNRAMAELRGLSAGEALAELNEAELFGMLQLSEEELVEGHMDYDKFSVAVAILAVRKELNGAYRPRTALNERKTPRDPNRVRLTKADLEALKVSDPLAYKLSMTTFSTRTESIPEARLKLASRVTRIMSVVD